mmetsp:Transcript_5606/g.15675  ORF Transcript_5606/g.15675 Transcript_5606/m.15675 type:complete len:416 (+) Transcript_5606:239-1486(+)
MPKTKENDGYQGSRIGWLKHSLPPGDPTADVHSLRTAQGDRRSLHSVDIDYENKRVATAGTDQYVKIWALSAVAEPQDNSDGPAPEGALLASIDTGCRHIDVARFAGTRNGIAFGDSNGRVRMYCLSNEPATPAFGSQLPANLENWKHARSVHVHQSMVLDMAWVLRDDRWLATAGMDNVICVLDGKTLRVLKRLSLDGPVKGVAWHPAAAFLTAQISISCEGEAAAKSIVVWETAEWTPVFFMDDGFGPDRTTRQDLVHLRHSWCPDGKKCIFVHCRPWLTPKMEQRDPVALVYNFSKAKKIFDGRPEVLRGHKQSVMVARYSPKMNSKKGTDLLMWALAGCDGRISVWLEKEPGPLLITPSKMLKRLNGCRDRFTDLAWSPDSNHLVAVSEGGHLAYLKPSAAVRIDFCLCLL